MKLKEEMQYFLVVFMAIEKLRFSNFLWNVALKLFHAFLAGRNFFGNLEDIQELVGMIWIIEIK